MHGFLNVNKPKAVTSRAAVDMVKRVCYPAKVGHTGTLDPIASGVLVICIGDTTRLASHVQRMRKAYRATFLLDQASDTDDTAGSVTMLDARTDVSRADLLSVIEKFVGEISQVPPKYSAAKVGGRRAYKLARNDVEFELKPRTVRIHAIDLIAWEYPRLELGVSCGSGTYVRSLGRDIAQQLGTGAVMSELVRTSVGNFDLSSTVNPATLDLATLENKLQPPSQATCELPQLTLTDAEIVTIRYGQSLEVNEKRQVLVGELNAEQEIAGLDEHGQLVSLMKFEPRAGQLKPVRNFRFS